jgi:flagellar assembly protein FliH
MAGIIKAGSQRTTSHQAGGVAFNFADMGSTYLTKVQGEANKIIEEARIEAAQIRKEAAEDGRRAAMQAVEATLRGKVEQQLKSIVPALKQAVQSVLDARQSWQRHWEQHALKLSTAIASRIVRREIQRVPLITVELVREALQLAKGNERITLRLNPTDHDTLKDHIAKLTAEMNSLAETRVIADSAITPGGCRVETEFGSIDQQLEAQLARITEELLA